MAISRALAAAFAAAVALAGCGGSVGRPVNQSSSSTPPPGEPTSAGGRSSGAGGAFDWLRPGPAPAGWPVATIPGGAAMPYPPGWQRIKSDPGTATAASFAGGDRFAGYLNLTPRQGGETLQNWVRFRVEHNADERERNVTTLAAAKSLRFGGARGSCIRDAYTTTTGARYIELACLVAGRHSSVVIVGASPPGAWSRISPLLERSISSVTA
jgi:hypothetical protein